MGSLKDWDTYFKYCESTIIEYERDFFHYTSPSGMTSILYGGNNNKVNLWASRFDCLNDMSEGQVVKDVFSDVCLELKETGGITKEYCDFLLGIKPKSNEIFISNKDHNSRAVVAECDRYLCSFSKNKDSLPMWNYYSKGSIYEGFNIEFCNCTITDCLKKLFEEKYINFLICEVIYDEKKQKQLIYDLILDLEEYYLAGEADEVSEVVSKKLYEWSLVFKSQCFSHEEEVRIIVSVAKQEKSLSVEHRINNGYLVPYIILEFEKHSVFGINYGPLLCNETQIEYQMEIMENMLLEKGFNVLVGYSRIPIRF